MTTDHVCQSCGMLLAHRDDAGTEGDGSRSQSYCRHCYQDGQFTSDASSAEEMVDVIASNMGHEPPTGDVRTQLVQMLQSLGRWQDDAAARPASLPQGSAHVHGQMKDEEL